MVLQMMSAPTSRSAPGQERSAAAPSATPRSTLAGRSPRRAGRKVWPPGMASTARAASPNVTALSRKARAGDPSSSRTPPRAGPAMTALPFTADQAALAPGRSASPTRRGVVAATHGR